MRLSSLQREALRYYRARELGTLEPGQGGPAQNTRRSLIRHGLVEERPASIRGFRLFITPAGSVALDSK